MLEPESSAVESISPSAVLLQLLMGKLVSQLISAAANLKIADALDDVPCSSNELADRIGVHGPSLYRLMRALTVFGVFTEVEFDRFAHTSLSRVLCDTTSGSLSATAKLVSSEWHVGAYACLVDGIRTGRPPFELRFGKNLFTHLAEDGQRSSLFDAAMAELSAPVNEAVVSSYDFSKAGLVVDVGGGVGALLERILVTQPKAKGVLFDAAAAAANARRRFEQAGLADRCSIVSGDFFEWVPDGGDLYILKHILHDWSDDAARQILRSCRRHMSQASHLLVIERLIPPHTTTSIAKLLDIDVWVLVGGRERTEEQYVALLRSEGFVVKEVFQTHLGVTILDVVPDVENAS